MKNLGGYKVVAISSASGTYAQKLAELKTTFDSLNDSQKVSAVLRLGMSLLTCQDMRGIFFAAAARTTTIVDYAYINTGEYFRSTNGTITDVSTTSNAVQIELLVISV